MLYGFCFECWCLEVEYDGANCQILCGWCPEYGQSLKVGQDCENLRICCVFCLEYD
jgi:hypothetical protein